MTALARFLGLEEEWTRSNPTAAERRTDVYLAFVWYVFAAVGLELVRSMGGLGTDHSDWLLQHLTTALAAGLLAFRRSHPLLVIAASAAHMLIVGLAVPTVAMTLPMQVIYFFALFSGVAWGRDRRALSYLLVGVLVAMFLWLTWAYAVSSGMLELQELLGDEVSDGGRTGLFPALQSAMGYIVLNNILFFGGAIVLGQVAWRGAHRTAQVVDQAETIRRQTDRLRDQAVVAERVRIARELHDVVAHHVSVMGVQAAAARRVLDRDPETARTALAAVETSSRDAVGQMRELLGTLRSSEEAVEAAGAQRSPQPNLDALPRLVEQAASPLLEVSYSLVEEPPGTVARVPSPLQLSAYRVVQESLANVRRHSTAHHASVVVRVDHESLEVEILNNGSARTGTTGTGLGQQGIRERAHLLGGTVDLGPRHGGGYRVRVRFPLGPVAEPVGATATDATATGSRAGADR